MKKNFSAHDWEAYLPLPVCEDTPDYEAFYKKAWQLARDHVKELPGMPQTPYMDEGLCDTQIWIWDTCFMSLFCKFAPEVFPGVESFKNFYEVMYHGTPLPDVIPTAEEPRWTGAVPGVPYRLQVHIADNPPLFAFAEYENALMHGDAAYIKELLYQKRSLQRHYDWVESLTERVQLPGVLLPTYLTHEAEGYTWEGGSSGMDNTPRGRTPETAHKERPNNPDMLWVDALCQQALTANCIAKLFALMGDAEGEAEWRAKHREKAAVLNRLYWDEKDGFYYDIDRNDHHFYPVMTATSYWALTAEAATPERAATMARHAEDPDTMGGSVPLLSLARNDTDFRAEGKYWRGSLWLPTAYAALKGLSLYGYHAEAQRAARKILDHMLATYQNYEPHTIWECYAPCAAEPATTPKDKRVRPDFCGWSALGPISVLIEYVLGFHTVNAFERTVEWEMPTGFSGEIGIRRLRFGDIETDILAKGKVCHVKSNAPYTLKICGKAFAVATGENTFAL